MGSSADHRTFGKGETYSQSLHLKIFVNDESTTDAPAAHDSEKVDKPINGVLPDLIEERIKANLELLNKQVSTLTQLLNQLIQDNSAPNPPNSQYSSDTVKTLTQC